MKGRQTTDFSKGDNPFIAELKGFVGKKVTVHCFAPTETFTMVGIVKAIDFHQRSVIIDDGKSIILVQRYLFMERYKSSAHDEAFQGDSDE